MPDIVVNLTKRLPRGAIPSPRYELAAAMPHVPDPKISVPPSFLMWPVAMSSWDNYWYGDCVTAEEAFAKATATPQTFIPLATVVAWASAHGVLNGASLTGVLTTMQTDGFPLTNKKYNDGPYNSVNWNDAATLQSAIYSHGPVKIGVGAGEFQRTSPDGNVTPGTSGWAMYDYPTNEAEDHCTSLCGYGTLSELISLFQQHGVTVNVPAGMPTGLCYAMFTWNSIGIIDQQSMLNMTYEAWIRNPVTTAVTRAFVPVYAQGDPGAGIGGYDLRSTADSAFAFDYDSGGRLDHLVLYRPGTGTIWILKNSGGAFAPVYQQGDPGTGIGGYDLRSSADRAFAFDYDSSGKLDHLVLYRPGTGTIWILKNSGGAFTPVYQQGDPGTGIGGYDLARPTDQAFAFDYDGSGKLDHLVLYRPGNGAIFILKNSGGQFAPVYAQGDPGAGIGGYDLRSTADHAFAYDYDSFGRLDHLALYRPGTGTIWILENSGGAFAPVYQQGDPGTGIGGYDLARPTDQAFAFDYDGSGKLDHLVLYRPGNGAIFIIRNGP